MITLDDLLVLSMDELNEVRRMIKDVRSLKSKDIVRNMTINSEFTISGDKNKGDVFILKKINRTKVVGVLKGTALSYTIPFEMIII